MNAKKILLLLSLFILFISCKTFVDLEKPMIEANELSEEVAVETVEKLKEQEEAYLIEELEKKVDVANTIVYVEKPIYIPADDKDDALSSTAKITGFTAVNNSLKEALKLPENFKGAIHNYDYDESFLYEIYCAPYRLTEIQLEPGEEVLEMPFTSEPEVWEISAGVSKFKGLDVQHFFIKPSYSKLTTSMIIITNRRVYRILLKSFKDSWMAAVKWNYPIKLPYNLNTSIASSNGKVEKTLINTSPEFLSFDYTMSYYAKHTPIWLPKRVYDDGQKTYIVLDDKVLFAELPALFDEKKNIINYRIAQNVLVIDSLIAKITLRLNKEFVSIEKKKQ